MVNEHLVTLEMSSNPVSVRSDGGFTQRRIKPPPETRVTYQHSEVLPLRDSMWLIAVYKTAHNAQHTHTHRSMHTHTFTQKKKKNDLFVFCFFASQASLNERGIV